MSAKVAPGWTLSRIAQMQEGTYCQQISPLNQDGNGYNYGLACLSAYRRNSRKWLEVAATVHSPVLTGSSRSTTTTTGTSMVTKASVPDQTRQPRVLARTPRGVSMVVAPRVPMDLLIRELANSGGVADSTGNERAGARTPGVALKWLLLPSTTTK